MRTIFGLITAVLLASPVLAGDVLISSNQDASTWVVIDEEIYFCVAYGRVEDPVCYKADMKD